MKNKFNLSKSIKRKKYAYIFLIFIKKEIKTKIISKLKLLLVLIIILFLKENIYYKINHLNKSIHSEKWIVMTVFNQPNQSLIDLLKILDSWKLVVIGNIKTNDKKWKKLNYSNKLIYLSIRDQIQLRYKTIKNLKLNSYARRNIGYLYAIQHGAKEIYEIDEDLIISNLKNIIFNFHSFNKTQICLGIRNDSIMINPYSYFGEKSIWPRGFRINDIGKEYNNKYFIINSSQLILKPLIFQGLINGVPDVDSIFLQTRIQNNKTFNIIFSDNYPLLYYPGNYIPINSKNTKYIYDIFPFIVLPSTTNAKLSDIIRGYILQRFVWGYNGAIIYHSTNIFFNKTINLDYNQFIEEKDLFFKLDKLLNILNKHFYSKSNNPKELLINLIKNLIKEKFLKKNDLNIYKAFLQDLTNFGYKFTSNFKKEIDNQYFKNLKKNQDFNLNLPFEQNNIIKTVMGNKNIKLINHYS